MKPNPNELCWDCGVKQGELHHWRCEVEVCPYCGGQVISCICFRAGRGGGTLPGWRHEVEKKGRLPYGSEKERTYWSHTTRRKPSLRVTMRVHSITAICDEPITLIYHDDEGEKVLELEAGQLWEGHFARPRREYPSPAPAEDPEISGGSSRGSGT